MSASTIVAPSLDMEASARSPESSSATITYSPSSGSAGQAVCAGDDLPPDCLYLLVSKAKTGPLAGTFKLGITKDLSCRHQRHTHNWKDFDLARSALVRVGSRRQVQHLESSLRRHFSNPEAEAQARAAGQQLSSADLAALNSYRRNPGCRKEGYTEFFAIECMEKMLEAAVYLLACNGNRAAGDSVQRGITLPTLAAASKRLSSLPKRAKPKLPAWVLEWPSQMKREQREQDVKTAAKTAQILELALAYESHVVWVDLTWWHHLLRCDQWRSWRYGYWRPAHGKALVELYFSGFAPASAKACTNSGLPPLTRAHFTERVASIVDWTCSSEPDAWMQEPPNAICCLDESTNIYGKAPPFFTCVGNPRIRLTPWSPAICEPYLAQFEALARRVAGRDCWQQRELGLELIID